MVGNAKKRVSGKTVSPTVLKVAGSAKASITPLDEGSASSAAEVVPSREVRIEEASRKSKEKNAKILERLAKL